MSSTHQVIDIIVQSATIDLFAGHRVAIAPVARHRLGAASVRSYELVGLSRFTSPTLKDGVLTLSASAPTLALIEPGLESSSAVHDCIRELTNQLMGRIKNKLARYGVSLVSNLPTAVNAQAMKNQLRGRRECLVYTYRTLKDDLLVTLAGDFDKSSFVFSTAAVVAIEGDVILFD